MLGFEQSLPVILIGKGKPCRNETSDISFIHICKTCGSLLEAMYFVRQTNKKIPLNYKVTEYHSIQTLTENPLKHLPAPADGSGHYHFRPTLIADTKSSEG